MNLRIVLISVWTLILLGCSERTAQNLTNALVTNVVETGNKVVIQGPLHTDKLLSFVKEVVIMPQAYISTEGQGEIRFENKVTVVGTSQVFDENGVFSFNFMILSELNPCWFGANGFDDIDDSKAFLTVLALAKKSQTSVSISVPVGRYIISEQLPVENSVPNEKAINLVGESISGNTIYGSCLQWHGKPDAVMLQIKNITNSRIENIEFTSYSTTNLKHNVLLEPYTYQTTFRNCSFSGCSKEGAANVNLNQGNNAQVSEISFDNCVFRGYTEDNVHWQTPAGVVGGLANTKNFYFDKCSFLGYTEGAIKIMISSILKVNDCTFSNNEIDIQCNLCNALIISNYSEQSRSFFKSGPSRNMSYTTLMNNYFDGHPEEDFIIREGSGSLVLINNSFGGTGYSDGYNKINWSDNEVSSITSISNYYRNDKANKSPFFIESKNLGKEKVFSINDLMGVDIDHLRRLINYNP